MERKIIKQGHQAFTITLPVKWIRDNNITSEVSLEQQDNSLIITPKTTSKIPLSEATINLKNYSGRIVSTVIFQAYRKGFDRISLLFTTKDQLKAIKETNKKLLGFEVVDEKQDRCIIQNIAEPAPEQYDVLLRRLFLQIRQESQAMLEELSSNKVCLQPHEEKDAELRRYTNYLRRVIIRSTIGGKRDSYLLFHLVSILSYIHQAFLFLYKAAQTKPSQTTLQIFAEVNSLFSTLYESFYQKDMDKAASITEAKKQLIEVKIYSALKKSKDTDCIILYHLGEIVRLIQYGGTAALFGILNPV